MIASKRIQKIIRESAFDNKKKKARLKFNPGLVLTDVRTTEPCSTIPFNPGLPGGPSLPAAFPGDPTPGTPELPGIPCFPGNPGGPVRPSFPSRPSRPVIKLNLKLNYQFGVKEVLDQVQGNLKKS